MPIRVWDSSATVDDVRTADVIVLTEGCEGEVFPTEPGRIPVSRLYGLNIAFVSCGGYSKVAHKYEEFSTAGLREKLIPTFDRDIIEQDKEKSDAWASPLRHMFDPCFEGEFPDWALAKAIEKCDPAFPIPEDVIPQARKYNRGENVSFYKELEQLGRKLHKGFRMPNKQQLTRALRDVLVHYYYLTPNIVRWVDHIIATGSKNKRLNIPSEGICVNWGVVRHLHLTGVLIYICHSDRKLWFIDFDNQRWEEISLPAESAKPDIRPMWSPDGKMIAFTGKLDNRTVTAVLTMNDHLREYTIDLGDPRRPTSLSDWDPCEGQSKHVFINGPDQSQGHRYRLWRAYYKGQRAIRRIEPLVGYSYFRKYGRQCIGIGGGGDVLRVLRLIRAHSVVALKDKEIDNGKVGALTWNYASPNLQFAFIHIKDDGPNSISTIQIAELDARKLEISNCTPLFPYIRFIQDLCWSPDGQSLLFTADAAGSSGDVMWLYVADLGSGGQTYPLLKQRVRIGGRSWFGGQPAFVQRLLAGS